MSIAFNFARIPQIHFGNGKIADLTAQILKLGNSVVVLTGKKSFISTPHWDALQEDIKSNQITLKHFTISGEPSPQMIDNIVHDVGDEPVDSVVAIGGGSVLDAGKAVAAMIGKTDSVKIFLEGVGTKDPDGTTLPFIAVPTTSGTGSECTKNAVISEVGASGFKKSLRHNNFVPEVAIVDPELTLNCPATISAMVGMDAFTQLLESYVSTKANDFTDTLAYSGLQKISQFFELMMKEPDNLEAREGMAYASMAGGITLANAGLGTVHGFASSLGGRFEIPHGAICSKLMEPCNVKTVKKLGYRNSINDQKFLKKYAKVGKLFSTTSGKNDAFYIDLLMETIARYNSEYCSYTLSEFGYQTSEALSIAQETGNKNNPIELSEEQLIDILESLK